MSIFQSVKEIVGRRIWLYRLVTALFVLIVSGASTWLVGKIPYTSFVEEVQLWLPLLKSVTFWCVFRFLPVVAVLIAITQIPFVFFGKEYLKTYDYGTSDSDDIWFTVYASSSALQNIAEMVALLSLATMFFIELFSGGYICELVAISGVIEVGILSVLGIFFLYALKVALVDGPKISERIGINRTFKSLD